VGLPLPAVIVTAEDVARGKPAPDGFLLAARRLGFDAADCLVFEDAPAGIAAAQAAGAALIVVTAAHPQPHPRPVPTPQLSVNDYDALSAEVTPTGSLELWRRSMASLAP
jgi:sugar-phosphatase